MPCELPAITVFGLRDQILISLPFHFLPCPSPTSFSSLRLGVVFLPPSFGILHATLRIANFDVLPPAIALSIVATLPLAFH